MTVEILADVAVVYDPEQPSIAASEAEPALAAAASL